MNAPANWITRTAILVIIVLSAGLFSCSRGKRTEEAVPNGGRFRRIIIDRAGPGEPWGKTVGDIDGDGFEDIVIGGHETDRRGFVERVFNKLGIRKRRASPGELVWYRNPDWQKRTVSSNHRFSTDHEVVDIDRDGRSDIVSLTDSALVWFRNPDWKSFLIDQRVLHDIEVADLDGDGDVDIVARNQSEFGYGDGDCIHFYRQDSPLQWSHFAISAPPGEGLKIADMNGDGRIDVIFNRYMYENPGILAESTPWKKREYSWTWDWPDVFIDTADINRDGRLDIVLAPSESEGHRYRISWFESPGQECEEWPEHIIDFDVETVHHFIGARDMDGDGRIDVVTAEMHQSEDPDEIAVYWGRDKGQTWEKEVIATTGSHSMRIADIDRDGDWDLIGANHGGEYQAIEIWENLTLPKPQAGWRRHVIDDAKPWRSVFVMAADLDRDGDKDILTGAWWYRNPGDLGDPWERRPIGTQANNVAVVGDFDWDGDPDILASQWKDERALRLHERVLRKLRLWSYPSEPHGGFVWARNDGQGRFEILPNVAAGDGDFLQGIAIIVDKKVDMIGLSWHDPGYGIQSITVPDDPTGQTWIWRRISSFSQDEQLSAGDIDGDGDQDLMLGTRWLRNEGNGEWTPFTVRVGQENPDRNRLADMSGDGKPDVIVGYEAISMPGKIAWYEQGLNPTSPWKERPIGIATGPMSLDVGDLDGDGDLDVVVGEHNLDKPDTARLLVFENLDGRGCEWGESIIYTGDEHHDGAQLVDIDQDGDLDVISIGWGHRKVLLYEHLGPKDGFQKMLPAGKQNTIDKNRMRKEILPFQQ